MSGMGFLSSSEQQYEHSAPVDTSDTCAAWLCDALDLMKKHRIPLAQVAISAVVVLAEALAEENENPGHFPRSAQANDMGNWLSRIENGEIIT